MTDLTEQRKKFAEADKAMDALLEAWARAQELDRIRDAAPALLEALKSVLPGIKADVKRGWGIFSDKQLAKVEAAIASARGVKK